MKKRKSVQQFGRMKSASDLEGVVITMYRVFFSSLVPP